MLPCSAVSPLSSSMSNRNPYALIGLFAALWCCTGNNVGRVFDRNLDPGEPGESVVQRMVPQGNAVNGRPRVREVFPRGNGWPGTVPIVVHFTETINEASVAPQTGSPNLFIPLSHTICDRKIQYIIDTFASQQGKQWFSHDTFLSILRLRGIEANSPTSYAEAFYCRKLVFDTELAPRAGHPPIGDGGPG